MSCICKNFISFSSKVLSKRTVNYANEIRSFAAFSGDNVSNEYDVVVVGGGIIGTATARELNHRHKKLKIALLEKEDALARHQSGSNSGVVHAGIYYTPGSLKAKLCVEGMQLSYAYFKAKKLPYKKVGKLIVATNASEVNNLLNLYERGVENKVKNMTLLNSEKEIKRIEPNCTGIKAIWSPETGIVDWAMITREFGKDFVECGGEIFLNFEVNAFELSPDPEYPVLIKSKQKKVLKSKYVLTCAGLQSDQIATLSGCPREPRIVPFRGEYLLLKKEKASMVKGNIYPVPDPRFPFLGVHFTPRMDGNVWLGPNAVLAFKREGYKRTDINLLELYDSLSYPGFRKMAMKYLTYGMLETIKSLIIPLQVRDLRKFVPSLKVADVERGPAGVRAQALSVEGELIEDFYFDMSKKSKTAGVGERILHCRNAPSPGATSSLAIAKMMADKIEKEFDLSC